MKQKTNTSTSEVSGRLNPQAVDFEETVLGAILIEKTAFETAKSILSPEMFYNDANKLIFAACDELDSERKPIDILTVVDRLRKTGNIETIGGASYISRLSQEVLSSVHLAYHCLVVKEKYTRRRLIEFCMENTSLAFDEIEDIDDIIAKLNSEVEQLQEINVGKSETIHVSKAAKQSIDELFVRIDNAKNKVSNGITTGFADLDRFTNGWKPCQLIILAARPGIGKTSIAIHMALKAAKRGISVVFFQLEMEESQLTDRMIIATSGVNAEEYNSGFIEPAEWGRAETAAGMISRLPVYIDGNAKVTVNNIANKARLLKKQGKCEMVIIDYLQLITPSTKQVRTREQEITEMSRLLKISAKELKVPFIVLCQMNRAIEGEKRDPRLSDLRESGSIEQDADMVIFINRPGDVKDKNTDEIIENYIELLIKKNRSGKLGKVKLKHNDSMTDFYDWDNRGQISATKNFYEPEKEQYGMPF